MKTLLMQTAIRPNAAKPVEYRGTLRDMWTQGNGRDPRDPVMYLDVWADNYTIHESHPYRLDAERLYVRFGSHGADETRITLFDEHGHACGEAVYSDGTPIQIRGVACDVTEECRTVVDVRDNPQQADVADEGGI